MCEVIHAKLQKYFADIKVASNGLEALEVFRNSEVDLILMDVRMPEMVGIEATKSIRGSQTENAGVPIIGLTNDIVAKRIEECMAAGMNDVLTKPLDISELLSKASNILHA